MTSTMTRTAPSPSLREKISRYDGRGSDSPFTEILLELAELETNDQLLSGIPKSSGLPVGKSQVVGPNTFNQQWDNSDLSTDKIKRQLESPSSSGVRDPAVRMLPIESTLNYRQIDIQAREYLTETIALLDQRITYSQIQLQVLTSQLHHDLPDFVARAMQLFHDNNQHLLGISAESSVLFFLEQKEFVDQAVSIYLRQFVPPPSSLTSNAQQQPISTESIKAVDGGEPPHHSNETDYMEWLIFNDTSENFDFDEHIEEVSTSTSETTSCPMFSQNFSTKEFNHPPLPFTARKRACINPTITHTPVSPTADVRGHSRDEIRAGHEGMMRSPLRMQSISH